MLHFYWPKTHIHLTLLLKDQCVKISTQRLAPVILPIVNPHSYTHKNILTSTSSYDMINSYDLKTKFFFTLQIDSCDPPSTLTTWYFHLYNSKKPMESGLSFCRVHHKSIYYPKIFNTVFPFLKILCLDHIFTWLHTSSNTSIHH